MNKVMVVLLSGIMIGVGISLYCIFKEGNIQLFINILGGPLFGPIINWWLT